MVGLLGDDVDPMVNVMKVDKAPTESYADIGGLQKQIQEVYRHAPRTPFSFSFLFFFNPSEPTLLGALQLVEPVNLLQQVWVRSYGFSHVSCWTGPRRNITTGVR